MKFIFLISFCLFFSLQDASAQIVKKEVELGDYFKKNIEDKDFSMSFQISSLGGKELFSYHSKDRLIPASILKILTTVAALRKLGGSYRFPTEIFVDSLPKQIGNEGEISVDFTEPPKEVGNLYLRGYGDPSMESKKLFELAEIIANFGIQEVKNVIFDDSLFLRPPSASGSEPHQAGLSALSINYNCYTAFITPMQIGLPAVVKLTPGAPYNLLNRVKTTRGELLNATLSESVFNNPTEGNNENLLDISGKEKQKTVIVDGTVGFNSDTVVQYHTVDDIKNFYAKIFEYYLKLNGVKIKGKLDFGEIPESAKHVYTHESKELSEIIQDLNHFSNNFIAGQILYAIGQGEDGYFNLELGLKRLREVLEKFGYKDDEFTLVDGSGLDKNNRLSAEQIVKVLIDAYSDFSVQPDLLASFSRFSKSGTLKKRQLLEPLYTETLRGSELEQLKRRGHGVWAKTGTLQDVSSLAGYLEIENGERFAFASIINGQINKDRAKKMEEEILKIILGVPNNFQPSKVVPKTLLPEKAAVKAEPAP